MLSFGVSGFDSFQNGKSYTTIVVQYQEGNGYNRGYNPIITLL
jgi:hypothetical protein